MIRLGYNSRRGQHYVEAYRQSDARGLGDVYNTYSEAKRSAFERCRVMCRDMGGGTLKIISHNSMEFTAAFTVTLEGGDHLYVITKCNDYIIPLHA